MIRISCPSCTFLYFHSSGLYLPAPDSLFYFSNTVQSLQLLHPYRLVFYLKFTGKIISIKIASFQPALNFYRIRGLVRKSIAPIRRGGRGLKNAF